MVIILSSSRDVISGTTLLKNPLVSKESGFLLRDTFSNGVSI
jgi:hypothetical protein